MESLSEFKAACADAIGKDLVAMPRQRSRNQSFTHSDITNLVCEHAVRYAARHNPTTPDQRSRMRRRCSKQVKNEAVCGFAILSFMALEFLGWIVQRAFDWICRHWSESKSTVEAIPRMAAECTTATTCNYDATNDGE